MPLRGCEFELAVLGRIQHAAFGGFECRPEREQFEKSQAKAVDIAARIGLGDELLRGHIPKRTEQFAGLCLALKILPKRQSEVCNPNRSGLVQEQVARLDIPVQDPRLVRIIQSIGHLGRQASDVAIVMLGDRSDRASVMVNLGSPWWNRGR